MPLNFDQPDGIAIRDLFADRPGCYAAHRDVTGKEGSA